MSWRTVTSIAPSETPRDQKLIRRLCRDEAKASKHRFGPSEQIRHTFLQVTQVKSVAAVTTCLKTDSQNLMPYAVPCAKFSEILTRKDLQLRLVSLAKRYVLSAQELKTVFRGLCFTPKLPLKTASVHLVLFSAPTTQQWII